MKTNTLDTNLYSTLRTSIKSIGESIDKPSIDDKYTVAFDNMYHAPLLNYLRREDFYVLYQFATNPKFSVSDQFVRNDVYDSILNPLGFVRSFSGTNRVVYSYLSIDSGMNRIGFKTEKEFEKAMEMIDSSKIDVEGIFTHFATADDFSQDDEYEKQLALFKSIVGNNRFKYIHCDNSAAMMFHHSDYGNLTRIGIAMYGVDPRGEENSDLKQAMSLYTKVAMVKVVPKGEKIGYGMTYTADEDQYIATLPIGYADGFTRANQGREVYINGHYYPVVGRVCMDQCMVKVDENVKPGDDVEIFGEHISLAKMAKEINTIPYEIICLISPRVERIYEK